MYAVALALSTLISFLTPERILPWAMSLTTAGQYEASESILNLFKEEKYKDHQFYHFVRLTNNFATNNQKAALKHAKQVEDTFEKTLARRHEMLAMLMLEELKHWQENDLHDIERDMRNSADRLAKGRADKKTQTVQEDIVRKLDRFIKEEEDQAKAKAEQAQKDAEGKQQGKQQGEGQFQTPAPESLLMGGNGAGKVDEKKFRQITENWGAMTAEKRAAVAAEVARDLPLKYKPAIDEYFKSLNRTHGFKK